MANIERRIAAMVALGTEALLDAPIAPSVAQACARRWLIEQARDVERKRAREVEEAAAREERERAIERHAARDRSNRLAFAWADERGGFYNDYDRRKFGSWIDGDPSEERWERCYAGVWEDRNLTLESYEQTTRSYLGELSTIIRNGVDAIIEERAADLDIEWTAALLTTTVALPGGERVTWGEATVEQHEARIAMLAKHAAGELETASRHRAAVESIKAAGVRCLDDLVTVTS